jgi:curved DNA-binding protein CbpA
MASSNFINFKDKNPENRERASEKFKKIAEAYETL